MQAEDRNVLLVKTGRKFVPEVVIAGRAFDDMNFNIQLLLERIVLLSALSPTPDMFLFIFLLPDRKRPIL
jgi:hypothetical protein